MIFKNEFLKNKIRVNQHFVIINLFGRKDIILKSLLNLEKKIKYFEENILFR